MSKPTRTEQNRQRVLHFMRNVMPVIGSRDDQAEAAYRLRLTPLQVACALTALARAGLIARHSDRGDDIYLASDGPSS